jgi:hypothetical protein
MDDRKYAILPSLLRVPYWQVLLHPTYRGQETCGQMILDTNLES